MIFVHAFRNTLIPLVTEDGWVASNWPIAPTACARAYGTKSVAECRTANGDTWPGNTPLYWPPFRSHRSAFDGGVMTPCRNVAGVALHPRDAAAVGRKPEVAVRILGNIENEIVLQSVGVTAFAPEMQELVAIEAVQTVLGAEPHEAIGVLQHAQYIAL